MIRARDSISPRLPACAAAEMRDVCVCVCVSGGGCLRKPPRPLNRLPVMDILLIAPLAANLARTPNHPARCRKNDKSTAGDTPPSSDARGEVAWSHIWRKVRRVRQCFARHVGKFSQLKITSGSTWREHSRSLSLILRRPLGGLRLKRFPHISLSLSFWFFSITRSADRSKNCRLRKRRPRSVQSWRARIDVPKCIARMISILLKFNALSRRMRANFDESGVCEVNFALPHGREIAPCARGRNK